MNSKSVCLLIADIEATHDVNAVKLDDVNIWPLIRYTIWAELLIAKRDLRSSRASIKSLTIAFYYLNRMFKKDEWKKVRDLTSHMVSKFADDVTTAFISQPVNLQFLTSEGRWFDRILDPLLYLLKNEEKVEKCYISVCRPGTTLYFPGKYLKIQTLYGTTDYSSIRPELRLLYEQAGITPERGEEIFFSAWKTYCRWYWSALKIFERSQKLKKLFVSCWYTPNMMGIIAAAKKCGISVIDVQHGKQGQYQAMYSRWTCIPVEGYQLMPNHFWCWGQPSCDHILQSSPERITHRPFVGGYPWPDYYKKFLAKNKEAPDKYSTAPQILFTLQPACGEHLDPIPDFIVEFMRLDKNKDFVLTFRSHPNFRNVDDYIATRLRNIQTDRYIVSKGNTNLFDEFIEHTHHITAYSSCCYEADMFNVPTLLFGEDSKTIYKDEIETGRFSWTSGNILDLEDWLQEPLNSNESTQIDHDQYILASLSHARKILREL